MAWRSTRGRRALAEEATALLARGQSANLAHDYAAAVTALQRAGEIGRRLCREDPDDDLYRRGLGSVLYTLGAALNALDRQTEAVEALTEAEKLYLAVPYPDGPLLVADVRLRRSRAHAYGGSGASAVIDAQRAVVAYVRRSNPDRMDDAYINLARTMMMASDILGAYGDPEVGLAAAQEGASLAVRAVNAGAHEFDQALSEALVMALSVEISLLGALGRDEETGNAVAALAHLGRNPTRTLLDVRTGKVPRATDGGVGAAIRQYRLLAGSDDGLPDLLLRQPVGPLVVPAFRCPPTHLPAAVQGATAASMTLLTQRAEAGVRLGLEAHYLSAFVFDESSERGGPVGADPVDIDLLGLHWCRLLAALADVVHAEHADLPLARDLAVWGTKAFLCITPAVADRWTEQLGPAVMILDRFDRR